MSNLMSALKTIFARPKSYREKLLEKTTKNTTYFSIHGNFLCKCVSVYDGDTINVVFDPFGSNGRIYRFRTRLLGIDTPEIKTKGKGHYSKGLPKRSNPR